MKQRTTRFIVTQQLRDSRLLALLLFCLFFFGIPSLFLKTLLTGGSDNIIAEFNQLDEATDDAQHALPFTERESQRLLKSPYLSKRQLAGIIKFRGEFEGDNTVGPFLKKHGGSWFSANYFQ